MGIRADFHSVLAAGAIVLYAALLSADNVKLDGGGSLSGSVNTGSKSVSVRTSTGTTIVFDRADVKQVARAKKASANANAKAQPKKRKLAPEEEAWMPKIRALVSRLYGNDREKSQQAKNRLQNVDDPDAIPALSTYLGSSRDEEARHLFVVILHNMKGPKPVYYLVALSLYDPSPQIRSEARKAIREDQLNSARLLYIAALRSGPPQLARIAAIGLGEIGDPRGDSVPFLINALVSYGTVATMT
jgi:HEAT repeat protein